MAARQGVGGRRARARGQNHGIASGGRRRPRPPRSSCCSTRAQTSTPPTTTGTTPLMLAAEDGTPETVQVLLKRGAAIDTVNEDGGDGAEVGQGRIQRRGRRVAEARSALDAPGQMTMQLGAHPERWCFAFVCALTLLAYLPPSRALSSSTTTSHRPQSRACEDPTLQRPPLQPRRACCRRHSPSQPPAERRQPVRLPPGELRRPPAGDLRGLRAGPDALSHAAAQRVAARRASASFATGAAFVFACHPIQVQAVTYIVQRIAPWRRSSTSARCSSTCAPAMPASVSSPGRPVARTPASTLLALAAFFSKENSASLPLAILLPSRVFSRPGTGAAACFACAVRAARARIPLTWKAFRAAPGKRRSTRRSLQQMEDLVYVARLSAPGRAARCRRAPST